MATGWRRRGTGRHDSKPGLRAKTRRSGPACYRKGSLPAAGWRREQYWRNATYTKSQTLPPSLEAGFEYRSIVGLDASDRSIPWQQGPSTTLSAPGDFTLKLPGLNPAGVYEYRAYVKHPLLTIYGADKRLPMT